ncbi:MAG: prepilin peptidase [Parcubacteria group bacterium]|nr:prepilin peptidase [Parcubacteria group bacterium]
MTLFLYVAVFIFGTIIGSFLNVLILRRGTGRSVVKDRSACWTCGKMLRWYELVPIVSYGVLRGKCARCKASVSPQYPIVEFLTGTLFTLGAWSMIDMFFLPVWGIVSLALLLAVIISLSVMMTVYDIRHTIIPNAWVYIFAVSSLVYTAVSHLATYGTFVQWSVWDMMAGPILAIPFAALWFFSKGKAMGLGDAKLALGIGWLLGLMEGLSAIILGFWIGAIISVGLISMHKAKGLFGTGKRFTMKSEIPFGPFLLLGMFVVFFFHIQALYLFV